MLGGRSLEATLRRARRELAAGDFDEAHRVVAQGLLRFPDAEALRETDMTIRRAQARAGISSLKSRIARDQSPRAHEELVGLYLELGLHGEARSQVHAYLRAHPDRDSPHLLLGEMSLQVFFEDLQARDAYTADRSLRKAALLNPDAIKPRLLLAELYFCAGADKALGWVVREVERLGTRDPLVQSIVADIRALVDAPAEDNIDGFFEQVEVRGALQRDPGDWPIRQRRSHLARVDSGSTQQAAEEIVVSGAAEELVVIHHGGALVACAPPPAPGVNWPGQKQQKGLVDVARTVAHTISQYARELDLGGFKRCSIEGGFGHVVVGEVGSVVAGVRWRATTEPQRQWERVTVGLEGSLRGGTR
jgi:hypothetical protein